MSGVAGGVDVDLSLAIREHVERASTEVLRQLLRAQARTRKPLVGSATAAAAPKTYTYLSAGGPPIPGRVWDVMRYVVSPGDAFSNSLAGVLVIPFITSGNVPKDSNTEPAGFEDLVDTNASVPVQGNWSRDQLTLNYGETLVFCFKGLAASQQVNLSGQVMEYWNLAHLADLVK